MSGDLTRKHNRGAGKRCASRRRWDGAGSQRCQTGMSTREKVSISVCLVPNGSRYCLGQSQACLSLAPCKVPTWSYKQRVGFIHSYGVQTFWDQLIFPKGAYLAGKDHSYSYPPLHTSCAPSSPLENHQELCSSGTLFLCRIENEKHVRSGCCSDLWSKENNDKYIQREAVFNVLFYC